MTHRKDPEPRRKRDIGVSRKTLVITGILLALTVAGALLSLYITGKVR